MSLHRTPPPARHAPRDETEDALHHAAHPLIVQCPLLMRLDCPVTLTRFKDRLYLASYAQAPSPDTPFPYPEQSLRSPSKKSTASSKSDRQPPCYFTVDDQLFYNAFHHDFGPFHVGHLYRFALQFHDVLGAKENQHRPIVFWSRSDPRSTYLPQDLPAVFVAGMVR